jgi:hypothetical protein
MRGLARAILIGAFASIAFSTPSEAGTNAPANAKDGSELDKVVCHRMSIPGRLDFRKTCKTIREWRAESDEAVRGGERMQELGLIKSCSTCR